MNSGIAATPEQLAGMLADEIRLGNQLPREFFLRQIKREFETNTLLLEWFPDVLYAQPHKESPKWSEDDGIVVKRRSNPTDAYTNGADCMGCANLRMRVEHHEGTRQTFWWRCEKGYALMEVRNFGQRVLVAPQECDAAGAFDPWKAGDR